jgi:hypothetical protein
VKTAWNHEFADDPVFYLSGFGDDDHKVRKVRFDRNGRFEWVDQTHETGTALFALAPYPPDGVRVNREGHPAG